MKKPNADVGAPPALSETGLSPGSEAAGVAATPPAQPRSGSVAGLLRQLIDNIVDLLHTEMRLAGSEIRENLAGAIGSLATVAAGLMLLSVAMLCLLGALVVWLSHFLGLTGAALAVGLVSVVVAIGLILGGGARLRATHLAPRRSAANLRRDIERLKGN